MDHLSYRWFQYANAILRHPLVVQVIYLLGGQLPSAYVRPLRLVRSLDYFLTYWMRTGEYLAKGN